MKHRTIIAAALAAIASPAFAQYSWLTNVGGNWSDPTKWTPTGVPNGAGVTAVVGQPNATITMDMNVTLASLTYGSLIQTITSVGRNHNIDQWTQSMGTALFRNSTLTGTTFTLGSSGILQIEGTNSFSSHIDNTNPLGWVRLLGTTTAGSSVFNFTTIDNGGDLWLDSTGLAWNVTANGTINNLAGGEIRTVVGTGGLRTFNGTINNSGAFSAQAATTMGAGSVFNMLAGSVGGAGGFDIVSGTTNVTGGSSTTDFRVKGGLLNFLAGSTATGAIQTRSTVGLTGTVNNGIGVHVKGSNAGGSAVLNVQGASNAGNIYLDAVDNAWDATLHFGAGFTNLAGGGLRMKTGSGGNRVMDGILNNFGTLDGIEKEFRITNGRLNMYGGTTFGTVSVFNSDLDFGAASTAASAIDFLGTGDLLGTVNSGSTVRVTGTNIGGSATATGVGTVTNNGVIELTAKDLAWNSTFDGTMVNNSIFRTVLGTGGTRFIRGHFTNNGQLVTLTGLTADSGTLLMNGGAHTGSGALTVLNGDLQLKAGSSTGTIINRQSDLMFLTGSTFTGTVQTMAASTLTGRVNAGATVEARGSNVGGSAVLSSLSAENAGTIILTAQELAWDATVSGSLVNLTGGMVRTVAGSGGARKLNFSLDNQGGSVEVLTTTSLGITGSDHENNGDVRIDSQLNVSGDTFENGVGGTIHGVGTLNMNAITLTNRGTLTGGNSVGTLTVDGNVNNTVTGSVFTEIASGSSYDKLAIDGNLTLAGGTIQVDLLGSFTPTLGQTFRVLTFTGTRTGFFDSVTGDGQWDILYGTNYIDIEAVPEPASLTLLALAGAGFIRRKRRA